MKLDSNSDFTACLLFGLEQFTQTLCVRALSLKWEKKSFFRGNEAKFSRSLPCRKAPWDRPGLLYYTVYITIHTNWSFRPQNIVKCDHTSIIITYLVSEIVWKATGSLRHISIENHKFAPWIYILYIHEKEGNPVIRNDIMDL